MEAIDSSVVRKHINVWGNTTITEEIAVISCLGPGSYNLLLPTAQAAAGLIFVFRCDDVDQAGAAGITITTVDADNIYVGTAAVAASITMNTIDDYTILYSDGNKWYQIAGGQT